MGSLNFNLRTLMLVLFLLFFASSQSIADDTEVYLGANLSGNVQPNVLFIVDTSGSMSSSVKIPGGSYDPSVTYDGACSSGRVYWSTGSAPTCSTSNWIDSSKYACADAASSLGSGGSGFYVARHARYKKSGKRYVWDALTSNDNSSYVECEADFGVHGVTSGSSNVYPADSSKGGPWTSIKNNAINWSSQGSNYTFYTANYLNWASGVGATTTKTRLQVVKEVFSDLVDSSSGINAALMRFDDRSSSYNKGGYFVHEMAPLNTSTRSSLKSAANSLTAGGFTPLSETLYEAARFYRGEGVLFGNSTSPGKNVSGVLDGANPNKYESPIDYQCQKNFVVLLTDGEPTYDTDADAAINALPGLNGVAGTCGGSNNCLDELAHYMYSIDQSQDHNDKQNVITYTIGFATDQTLLKNTAQKGGGSYHTADNTSGLTDAFTRIITEILAVNTSFVAPAVSVNSFNRLTHRDEVYFALFRPSGYPDWAGNIKRYALSGNPPIVVDANGGAAVDVNTGFFRSSSVSFWTSGEDAPDGDNVSKGGSAGELTLPRNVYTYSGSGAPSNHDMTADPFHESNAAITTSLLGISGHSDDYRQSLIKWARGVDVFDDDGDGAVDDVRRSMGDPLHSKPVLVTYGGTDENPDITLFFGGNDGFLRAIDTSNGSEIFSFIPKELLPNLNTLYDNSPSNAHPYGLDGPITAWVDDADGDSIVDAGDRVYLYVGMRRGGSTYYAFDVTNRAAPKLLWQIDGGSGQYTELGQSWSRPVVTKVKINGAEKDVIVFGGGYDTNQDYRELHSADSVGRAIYIADAKTGERLWWAGRSGSGANLELSGLDNSIPAKVSVVDINGDGFADMLFASDMGGRVWRIDISQTNTGANSMARGGLIANFGGSGTSAADNRRFYYEPDISLVERNGALSLAIGIGSGYREHPLSTSNHDRFYMFFDANVYSGPSAYSAVTESDLYDATSNLVGSLSGDSKEAEISKLNASSGWYIRLPTNGEKVLAPSRTVNGITMFTTFTPVSSSSSSCAPSQGVAKAYFVSQVDASPLYNLDNLGSLDSLTTEDRYHTLTRGGLPPEPTVLFPSDGSDPIVLVGPEKVEKVELNIKTKKTSWRAE